MTNSVLGASAEEGESALFLARLGFSAFLSMNIFAISWMVYDRGFATFGLTADVLPAFETLLFVLSIPVMLLVGVPYAIAAWKELRTLSISTDSLIAVGSFSAFVFSTWQLATGGVGMYYDTATMTLVLVTFGRYVEATAKGKAQRSLKELLELQPQKARRLRDGIEELVDASLVGIGDTIRVLAGERIPVDGTVLNGTASVDESALTGESMPRSRQPGEPVYAATLDLDGTIDFRADSVSDESAHAQAVRLLEEARTTRSPLQRTVDRISAVFLPAVIFLAVAAFGVWALFVPIEQALITGLTVLVVSCPCALGIGTPLALTYALHKAASEGVLIRTHLAIEQLSTIRMVLFDKTGTLTTGRPTVRSWFSVHPIPDVQKILASLESQSTHPIGRGIVASSRIAVDELLPVRDVHVLPGTGIEGDVSVNGEWKSMRIIHAQDERERRRFASMMDPSVPLQGDESEVLVFMNREPFALLRIADGVREDTPSAITALRDEGIPAAVISGDTTRAVLHVASLAGIPDAYGELLPAGKLEKIRSFAERRGTAMVGDGINDAPSLAAAHVGIAMAGGTDIAKENADVVIVGDRLSRVPWLLDHARRTMSIIRWNLFWAFGYNIVAIALALSGLLQPVIAAAAMVLSSVTIIAHSRKAGQPTV